MSKLLIVVKNIPFKNNLHFKHPHSSKFVRDIKSITKKKKLYPLYIKNHKSYKLKNICLHYLKYNI